MTGRPPGWARALLRLTPLAIRRPDVVEDLEELYAQRAREQGAGTARRRYARDVLSLWLHAPLWPGADPRDHSVPPDWGTRMERLLMDVRYAVRRLRATPLVSAIAIATVALAVGANTAIFSITDAALFRPAPFAGADRIVNAYETEQKRPDSRYSVALPTMNAWRERRDLFEAMATWKNGSVIVVEREPERLAVDVISTDYFAVYGIRPLYGRTFTDADMRPGAEPVAILSYRSWQKYFNGDPAAIGRPLRLSDAAPIVVGVLPPDLPWTTPLYRPLQPSPAAGGAGARQFGVIGRLARGMTIERAQPEVERISKQLVTSDEERATRGALVEPYGERIARYAKPTLQVLSGSVLFVLLIACVNVAGLMFARGATRDREIALRASLGAGRLRLVQQLLVESCVLSIAGGAVGALTAWRTLDALVAAVPLSLPATARPAIDLRVLAFALALSTLCGVVAGLAPAWRLARTELALALASGSRTSTSLPRLLTRGLIAIEIALALVLVCGASLMIRSLALLYGVDKGFRPDGVLTMESAPVQNDDATYRRYYAALLDRVRALPGVEAAGGADTFPLGLSRSMTMAAPADDGAVKARGLVITSVVPGFFDAMGIPLRGGRVITEGDRAGTPKVAVLNERAARAFFPSGSAVGRQLKVMGERFDVVGVVSDVRSKDLAAEPEPEAYLAYAQRDANKSFEGRTIGRPVAIIVRTSADPRALAATLRGQAQGVGEPALVQRVRTLDDWIADSARITRQRATLFTLLGSLGLVLAAIGVFGMTSYAVSQRTREIGVRVAMGATPRDIMRTVGSGAAGAIAVGLAAGLAATFWLTRLIASFLYEVKPLDGTSITAAALVLVVAGSLAAYLPARRALRVDPVVALRNE